MWEDEAFVQLDFDLEDGPDDSHGKPPNVSEDELRQLDENAAKREVTREGDGCCEGNFKIPCSPMVQCKLIAKMFPIGGSVIPSGNVDVAWRRVSLS